MKVRRIKRGEFEELYNTLVSNLTSHAYESITGLLDDIEAMVEEGRLTPELIELMRELLQSLSELLRRRDEMSDEERRVVDESLREGFSIIAEVAGREPDLIEDAVEVLTELYGIKELLDKVQRRIVSLLDALTSYRELTRSGIPE